MNSNSLKGAFFVFFGAAFMMSVYFFYFNSRATSIDIQNVYNKENLVGILVAGSGCAGYSAALYAARGKIKTIILAGGQPGGQLNGTTKVENFPGLFDQMGPDIMQKLQNQAEHFGAEVIYDSIKDIDCSVWPYVVTTVEGKKLYVLALIIATGASPLLLNIPGEKELWARGVTTCAICDAAFHKGNDVVVIGGGDSAAEEALQLSSYAKTITILVRKDAMRASQSMQDRLKEVTSIKIMYNVEVKEIIGNEDKGVTAVRIYNNKTDTTSTMAVSGVFLAIGHVPNSKVFSKCITIDKEGYIITKSKGQLTSMPGIFAAGDVEDKVYRQAGVAAGSGIKAALDALSFLQHHGFNAQIAQELESHYFTNKESLKPVVQAEIKKITSKADFDRLRAENAVFFADFYTTQCPSCKAMMPALQAVASTLIDKVVFATINADQLSDLADRYKISSVPTLLLFKNGALIDRRDYALSEVELTDFVKKAL